MIYVASSTGSGADTPVVQVKKAVVHERSEDLRIEKYVGAVGHLSLYICSSLPRVRTAVSETSDRCGPWPSVTRIFLDVAMHEWFDS